MDEPSSRALFFWGKDTLDRGDSEIMGAYLFDLSWRLRDNPTLEECEAAAQVCERIAAKGHPAWVACGFIAAHRPNTFRRHYCVWADVRDLVIFHHLHNTQAYARVARRYGLSAGRVKAIFLKLERSTRGKSVP